MDVAGPQLLASGFVFAYMLSCFDDRTMNRPVLVPAGKRYSRRRLGTKRRGTGLINVPTTLPGGAPAGNTRPFPAGEVGGLASTGNGATVADEETHVTAASMPVNGATVAVDSNGFDVVGDNNAGAVTAVLDVVGRAGNNGAVDGAVAADVVAVADARSGAATMELLPEYHIDATKTLSTKPATDYRYACRIGNTINDNYSNPLVQATFDSACSFPCLVNAELASSVSVPAPGADDQTATTGPVTVTLQSFDGRVSVHRGNLGLVKLSFPTIASATTPELAAAGQTVTITTHCLLIPGLVADVIIGSDLMDTLAAEFMNASGVFEQTRAGGSIYFRSIESVLMPTSSAQYPTMHANAPRVVAMVRVLVPNRGAADSTAAGHAPAIAATSETRVDRKRRATSSPSRSDSDDDELDDEDGARVRRDRRNYVARAADSAKRDGDGMEHMAPEHEDPFDDDLDVDDDHVLVDTSPAAQLDGDLQDVEDGASTQPVPGINVHQQYAVAKMDWAGMFATITDFLECIRGTLNNIQVVRKADKDSGLPDRWAISASRGKVSPLADVENEYKLLHEALLSKDKQWEEKTTTVSRLQEKETEALGVALAKAHAIVDQLEAADPSMAAAPSTPKAKRSKLSGMVSSVKVPAQTPLNVSLKSAVKKFQEFIKYLRVRGSTLLRAVRKADAIVETAAAPVPPGCNFVSKLANFYVSAADGDVAAQGNLSLLHAFRDPTVPTWDNTADTTTDDGVPYRLTNERRAQPTVQVRAAARSAKLKEDNTTKMLKQHASVINGIMHRKIDVDGTGIKRQKPVLPGAGAADVQVPVTDLICKQLDSSATFSDATFESLGGLIAGYMIKRRARALSTSSATQPSTPCTWQDAFSPATNVDLRRMLLCEQSPTSPAGPLANTSLPVPAANGGAAPAAGSVTTTSDGERFNRAAEQRAANVRYWNALQLDTPTQVHNYTKLCVAVANAYDVGAKRAPASTPPTSSQQQTDVSEADAAFFAVCKRLAVAADHKVMAGRLNYAMMAEDDVIAKQSTAGHEPSSPPGGAVLSGGAVASGPAGTLLHTADVVIQVQSTALGSDETAATPATTGDAIPAPVTPSPRLCFTEAVARALEYVESTAGASVQGGTGTDSTDPAGPQQTSTPVVPYDGATMSGLAAMTVRLAGYIRSVEQSLATIARPFFVAISTAVVPSVTTSTTGAHEAANAGAASSAAPAASTGAAGINAVRDDGADVDDDDQADNTSAAPCASPPTTTSAEPAGAGVPAQAAAAAGTAATAPRPAPNRNNFFHNVFVVGCATTALGPLAHVQDFVARLLEPLLLPGHAHPEKVHLVDRLRVKALKKLYMSNTDNGDRVVDRDRVARALTEVWPASCANEQDAVARMTAVRLIVEEAGVAPARADFNDAHGRAGASIKSDAVNFGSSTMLCRREAGRHADGSARLTTPDGYQLFQCLWTPNLEGATPSALQREKECHLETLVLQLIPTPQLADHAFTMGCFRLFNVPKAFKAHSTHMGMELYSLFEKTTVPGSAKNDPWAFIGQALTAEPRPSNERKPGGQPARDSNFGVSPAEFDSLFKPIAATFKRAHDQQLLEYHDDAGLGAAGAPTSPEEPFRWPLTMGSTWRSSFCARILRAYAKIRPAPADHRPDQGRSAATSRGHEQQRQLADIELLDWWATHGKTAWTDGKANAERAVVEAEAALAAAKMAAAAAAAAAETGAVASSSTAAAPTPTSATTAGTAPASTVGAPVASCEPARPKPAVKKAAAVSKTDEAAAIRQAVPAAHAIKEKEAKAMERRARRAAAKDDQEPTKTAEQLATADAADAEKQRLAAEKWNTAPARRIPHYSKVISLLLRDIVDARLPSEIKRSARDASNMTRVMPVAWSQAPTTAPASGTAQGAGADADDGPRRLAADPVSEVVAFLNTPPAEGEPARPYPVGVDLFDALREAAGSCEDGKHSENREAPCLDNAVEPLAWQKKNGPVDGAIKNLPSDFYQAKHGRYFTRQYRVLVDKDTWRRLRDAVAEATVGTNFLLCVVAETLADNETLFENHEDHRFSGMNLRRRLRVALAGARRMLIRALRRGKELRAQELGVPVEEDDALDHVVVHDSCVEGVWESTTSLQELYREKPHADCVIHQRNNVPLFIETREFNNTTTTGKNGLFSRVWLAGKRKGGLPPAAGRVTLQLDNTTKNARRVILTYQPDIVTLLSTSNVTLKDAKRNQISRLPGGLRFREADGATELAMAAPTPAHYEVMVDERPSTTVRDDGADVPAPPVPCVLSVDPGGKTLGTICNMNSLTLYETNGREAPQFIRDNLRTTDKLDALCKATNSGGGHARFLREQGRRVRKRLKNFVTNAHHEYANFLVNHRQPTYILLPRLPVAAMVRRSDAETGKRRCLNKMAARTLVSWSHWRLRSQVLAHKLRYYPEVCLLNCSESYSTKGKCARTVVLLLWSCWWCWWWWWR
jgi:hypothetical protein